MSSHSSTPPPFFTMCAGIARSSYEELTDEPTQTCATLVPATSRTGTTLSGLRGLAMSGSRPARSITISSSYRAPSSPTSSRKSSGRSCASRKARVRWSAGKIPKVAPSSRIMLQMVARWGTDRVATPSPSKRYARLIPPLTVIRRSISRITSFADTHGWSSFSRTTLTTAGHCISNGMPAIATAASMPPMPSASDPTAPAVVVCESDPTSVA